MNWQLIIFLLLISPLWGWFNVWLIRTIYAGKGGDSYSKQWHFWQVVLRLFVVTYACSKGWSDYHLWYIFLIWWAYDYIVYPGVINLYAFKGIEKRGFFYVGRKDRIDKHPDALQLWLLKKDKPELWSACIKIGFLLLTLIPLLKKLL